MIKTKYNMYRAIILLALSFLIGMGCRLGKNRIIQTPMENWSAKISMTPPVDTSRVLDFISLANFEGDTLAYLRHNFYERQGVYLNKKLDVLLHDLEIPVSTYVNGSSPIDTLLSPFLYLEFHNGLQTMQREKAGKPSFDLIIYWAEPLHSPDHKKLGRESLGKWTPSVKSFYKEQVVGVIKMMKKSLK